MSRANLHTQQTLSSLLLFILLPLASAAAVTVEERLSLDELDAVPVVLTPSRIVQPIDESPAAVTIIGRKKIEASGIRSIAELFRLVPGMFVVYSNGLLPQVKYHGLDTAGNSNSRHLQVLIDGRSIYQSGFSRVLWTDIPLLIEDIERIEVVRSPSTVSHGTNAFMGVINIITRNPADTTQLLTLSTGSQQQREMGFRHSDTYGQLNYRLSMKYAEDAGFDTSQKRDGQDLHLLNIRGEYSASPSDQLDLDLGYKSGDKEDSTLTGPTEGRWSNHYQNIGWTHDLNLNDQLQLTAYHQQRQVKQEWGNNNDINWDEERYHLDLQYNKTHSEQLRSVSGGSIRHDRVKAPTYFGDNQTYRKNSHQLYGNLEWRPLPPLLIHSGVMWDHEDVGNISAFSPRVALNYHLNSSHTLRASYSKAIRSPDLLEQFAYWTDPDTATKVAIASSRLSEINKANHLLEPEEITAHELGWHFQLPQQNSSGDIKLYQEQLSNLTALTLKDADGAPISARYPFTHSNLDWAEINGIEFEGHWKPSTNSSLDISYAHIFSYNSNNPDLSNSSPRDITSLFYTHRFNSTQQGSLSFTYTSPLCGYLDYATEPNGCSDTATDYTSPFRRIDLSLQQKLSSETTLQLLLKHHIGNTTEFNNTNSNHGKSSYTVTLRSDW